MPAVRVPSDPFRNLGGLGGGHFVFDGVAVAVLPADASMIESRMVRCRLSSLLRVPERSFASRLRCIGVARGTTRLMS